MSIASDQLVERIHEIIQSAVQRAGGNWKGHFFKEVCQIIAAVDNAQLQDSNIVSQKID